MGTVLHDEGLIHLGNVIARYRQVIHDIQFLARQLGQDPSFEINQEMLDDLVNGYAEEQVDEASEFLKMALRLKFER